MDAPRIVITGSTRGIGFGLARAFCERGCSVVVTGRARDAVDAAVARLGEHAVGCVCDVSDAARLESLWAAACDAFGGVDVWINNAGTCNAIRPFVELDAGEVRRVLDTNLYGAMMGSHVALRGMLRQGHGKLFNMEGWGSHGETSPGMAPYSTTKRAIRYFTTRSPARPRTRPCKSGR